MRQALKIFTESAVDMVVTKSQFAMMAMPLQALTDPQRKKRTGRSIDAMFYIVVTLITP